VTVLLTVVVPEVADGKDAAALLTIAAESTAIDVVYAVGVEGHFPVPGSTVLRGHHPWVVRSLTETTAVIADLNGSVVEVSTRALWPGTIGVGDDGRQGHVTR